jgi:hypothetical protein
MTEKHLLAHDTRPSRPDSKKPSLKRTLAAAVQFGDQAGRSSDRAFVR